MGVDPGLQKTGWGVLRYAGGGRGHAYVDSGLICTRSTDAHLERLRIIGEGLQEVVHALSPDLICIERVFVNKNPKVSLALGEARGAAIHSLMSAQAARDGSIDKIAIKEISALQIKQSVTGAGRASKQRVAAMVAQLLNHTLPESLPHDCTDALACALAGTATLSMPRGGAGLGRRRAIPSLRQLAKSQLAKNQLARAVKS